MFFVYQTEKNNHFYCSKIYNRIAILIFCCVCCLAVISIEEYSVVFDISYTIVLGYNCSCSLFRSYIHRKNETVFLLQVLQSQYSNCLAIWISCYPWTLEIVVPNNRHHIFRIIIVLLYISYITISCIQLYWQYKKTAD